MTPKPSDTKNYESPTKRIKKSTARFIRDEINKTQSNSSGMFMRIVGAIIFGLIISFAYAAMV